MEVSGSSGSAESARDPHWRVDSEGVIHFGALFLEFRNFFKHAKQDPNPDSSVELRESEVAAILFLAVGDYIRLHQSGPVEALIFQAWFVAVFPDKVADNPGAQSILEKVNLAFPGIATRRCHVGGVFA